jgi:uncharacterized membrane protein YbaN (DUF454 family)
MLKHIHRGLWLAAGLFFTVLGVTGLLLPVVPQLPFFLAAIICFMRCSNRFNGWMERQPWFIRLRARFRNLRHPWC